MWLAVTKLVAIALLVGFVAAPLFAIACSALLHGFFMTHVFPHIIQVFNLPTVCG